MYLPGWARRLYRRYKQRGARWMPQTAVFSENVCDDGSIRRYSRIVDIRSAEGGHELSYEVVMILVLALEEDWLLFPTRDEAFHRVPVKAATA